METAIEKVKNQEPKKASEEIAEHKKEEAIEKSHSKNHPIKEKAVKNLVEKIKNAKTLMIVSIKGLPSKQFQDIKKSIRGHASVLVAKKNIMLRAIKAVGKESILGLEEHIKENSAFAISDIDGYELAGILAQKKNPIYAKAGQESSEDIEIQPGPTDLVPGPAISELGSVGLQVAVVDGKISIKSAKVIVTKGQEITENVASILQKLNIMPFSVGLEPMVIYDIETEKIYTEIKIDSEEATNNLKSAAGKALGFAQKIVYFCKETIGYLLAKANAEGESISKLENSEASTNAEPKDSDNEETKEEKPAEESEKSDIDKKKEVEETQTENKSEEEK